MKKNLFFIIILSIWIFSPIILTSNTALPSKERAALIAFYNATDGDNWIHNSGWKTPPLYNDGFAMPGTENNWFGIEVENNHVIEITVSNNYLNGFLPPEIGDFKMMYALMVMDNGCLRGSIPPEVGKLSNLIFFYSQRNNLTGSIPPEMGNLKNLKYLQLYDNNLSGELPPELGNMSNLENLMISDNLLSGGIPPEFGKLKNLAVLSLTDNRLDGRIPSEFGNLVNLQGLFLDKNRLIGEIPASLVNLQIESISISYNALHTNSNTLRAFLESRDPEWESTQTISPTDVTLTLVSNTSVDVSWTPISFSIYRGGYNVYYRSEFDDQWTFAGITANKRASNYTVTDLLPDLNYCFAVKTLTYPNDANENTVESEFSEKICIPIGSPGPVGEFDTPLDGAIVEGSIPVTGWALDNLANPSVKIFRESPRGDKMVFIGDAIFTPGARPDVEQLYPNYPNNHMAGWGYMLLTNLLPNSGNGTVVLHAIATDVEGNQVSLGKKVIFCNNDNAIKPFGTIDTPGQGETASGKDFVNFGWALTPLPKTIPADGSTILVWVDGVQLGHPGYNIPRPDIAALFPKNNNSNGAGGYFYLDTTKYEAGLHTIQWTVTDNAGETDGIGSRYFVVSNTSTDNKSESTWLEDKWNNDYNEYIPYQTFSEMPIENLLPIRIKKGYNANSILQTIYPDINGEICITVKELDHFEIQLGDSMEFELIKGFQLVGKKLKRLPVGSTLQQENGIFAMQLGPSFLGDIHLVFVMKHKSNNMFLKKILLKIIPKY